MHMTDTHSAEAHTKHHRVPNALQPYKHWELSTCKSTKTYLHARTSASVHAEQYIGSRAQSSPKNRTKKQALENTHHFATEACLGKISLHYRHEICFLLGRYAEIMCHTKGHLCRARHSIRVPEIFKPTTFNAAQP